MMAQGNRNTGNRKSAFAELRREEGEKGSYDVIVIGGGSSGLLAALSAAERGASVLIVESLNAPGKKLLASGNGRCNLSSKNVFPSHYSKRGRSFTGPVLSHWTAGEMRSFWAELGLAEREEDGRMYPYSLEGKSVRNILLGKLSSLNVRFALNTEISEIKKISPPLLNEAGTNPPFYFVIVSKNKRSFRAKRVIVCTGGMAAPALGCTGEGYKILESFGHRLFPPYPALVQLICPGLPRLMAGTRVRIRGKIISEDGESYEERGELLFTDYGISGICVMNLSEYAALWISAGKKVYFQMDFLPDIKREEGLYYIEKLKASQRSMPAQYWGIGLVPERVSVLVYNSLYASIEAAVGYKGGNEKKAMAALDSETLKRLITLSKTYTIPVSGTKGFDFAQVTGGGIYTENFNPYTMESELCRGVYAAGEILDVNGPCGGFNLHWAFASGLRAGKNAALSLTGDDYV